MPIPKCFDFEDYNQYPGEDNATTDAEIQDYFKNQNILVKSLASRLWQPGTAYEVDDVVFSPNLPKGVQAVCVQAGTSDANVEPSWNAEVGAVTPDGSVYWEIHPVIREEKMKTVDGAVPDETGNVSTPIMQGATNKEAGRAGRVPAPEAGAVNKVLFGDGTWKILLELVYPVGSLYWSKNPADPSTLFGGTWARVKDKFVLAAGDSYAQGATGGAATVALTTAQMPAHSHTRGTMNITGTIGVIGEPGYYTGAFYRYETKGAISNSGSGDSVGGFDASLSWTGSTSIEGSGSAHENMPPYVAYYCWERIA